MKAAVIFFALLATVSAQRYVPGYAGDIGVPNPYSFNYVAVGDEGQSSHQEQGDGNGRVQGSYSLNDIDGISRVVEYVADEGGFRAVVKTNEPGTANQNPADVVVESSADGGPISTRSNQIVRPGIATGGGRQGVRYVLVPVTDPRARNYA